MTMSDNQAPSHHSQPTSKEGNRRTQHPRGSQDTELLDPCASEGLEANAPINPRNAFPYGS